MLHIYFFYKPIRVLCTALYIIRNSLFKMNISSNDKNEYNNMTFIIIL